MGGGVRHVCMYVYTYIRRVIIHSQISLDHPPLQKEFKGKAGSAAGVRLGGQAVKALTLVGLGKKSAFKSARAVSLG